MNRFGKSIGAPGDVIATATKCVRCKKQAKKTCAAHGSSFSANFTAFAAGRRKLSAAAQNHHAPELEGSACGVASWSDVSPAGLMSLGADSAAAMVHPAEADAFVTTNGTADRVSHGI